MKATREMDRRRFLQGVGGAAAAIATLAPERALASPDAADGEELATEGGRLSRRRRSLQLRRDVALEEFRVRVPPHHNNGDEERYPNRIANYSKGLVHNGLGEVDLASYASLRQALSSGEPDDFEQVIMGAPLAERVKLVNPQAGLAFDLEGTDSHQLAMPPAPTFRGREQAAEMVEDYWISLARDVAFIDYARDRTAQSAAEELTRLQGFTGPRDENGNVTAGTLFRGPTPGDLVGPYVSQFLLLPAVLGSETIDSRQRTIQPGLDYMTGFDEWLSVQNGFRRGSNQFHDLPRYIRNGRDLSAFVHVDALFQAYFLASLILVQLNAPLNPGNPYRDSQTQVGFGTFGGPHLLTVLVEGCTRALKAVWYQKWFVHRRLRPEVFAARVHNHKMHLAEYEIHADVLDSQVVQELEPRYHGYLLPMAFPEGCPSHPSYGAGHATVAGCCVTLLKAVFDGGMSMRELLRAGGTTYTEPVESSSDGLSLIRYHGHDLDRMTVEGELNKVAANIGLGRNHAGVHWRTDDVNSLYLGEAIAISILRDQESCYNEEFGGFTFTKFDGMTITV